MMSPPLAWRMSRYTAMGAICAVTHNALMILGDNAGVSYVPMSLFSFLIVTPLGYALHASFTFRVSFSIQNFFRFSAGVAAGFPLYFIVITFLCSFIGLSIVVASPITTIILYVWNYLFARWAMYNRLGILGNSAIKDLAIFPDRRPSGYGDHL